MRRWDGLVDRYMEEYTAAGRAAGTIEGVRRELDRCGTWLKNRRPRPKLEEIGSDLLIGYLQSRSSFRSKSTLSSVMSRLRCWGEFLLREGLWRENPLRWLRGPKRDPRSPLPRRIPRPGLSQLWETAATSRSGYHRYLWITLLSVLYGTGARRGEIERLDVSDWDGEQGLLQIDGRKTRRERQVPVPALVWRCLETYLPKRQNHLASLGCADDGALFVNKHGRRLQGKSISDGIKTIARRGGVEHLTLHQFRHTCASDLLEDGAHLSEVQQLLGHQTIETTVRYLHIADPQLHASVQLHPINTMLQAEEGGRS
jgi:site-specific recombinase XerD